MLDMKRFLLLFLLISSSISVDCQVQVDIDVMAKDLRLGKKEAGVTVRVYEGSKVVASGVTSSSGKVILNVPSEKFYKVEFSKSGKVTRFANLNAGKIDVYKQFMETPLLAKDSSLHKVLIEYNDQIIKKDVVGSPFMDMIDSYLAVLKIYTSLKES